MSSLRRYSLSLPSESSYAPFSKESCQAQVWYDTVCKLGFDKIEFPPSRGETSPGFSLRTDQIECVCYIVHLHTVQEEVHKTDTATQGNQNPRFINQIRWRETLVSGLPDCGDPHGVRIAGAHHAYNQG